MSPSLCRHGFPVVLLLLSAVAGCAADLASIVHSLPQPVLGYEYHSLCHRPCELVGFSFSGSRDELKAMRACGANAVGLGAMWNPVPDPAAPNGCGVLVPVPAGKLAQSFVATAEFDGLAPCLPTGFSRDSGCSWAVYRADETAPPATGAWKTVDDNSWPEARFAAQPPGQYRFELSLPTGTWIGWWGRPTDVYSQGEARVANGVSPSLDFELRIHSAGEWADVVPPAADHRAVHLGPGLTEPLAGAGLVANISVGNWNNPGFPYYPEWFIDKFPEHAALDQHGRRFEGGMFDKLVPAPGIESPVIVDGTSRFIRTTVAALRDNETVKYWVMGGEALYATYMDHSRWTDYSPAALRHFRAWLQEVRYTEIDGLNVAWGTALPDFSAAEPPRAPEVSRRWLDWLDYRFAAMGERFSWHYRATRSQDPDRMVMSCNHGTLYHGDSYAAMGARPELYAAASDGFETGQIMYDDDPDLYNIMYTETLNTLGKPYCPVRLAYKRSDPGARGGGTSYTPEAARRYMYESLGADAWHLGLIQWSGSLPDGEWGVVGTPAERTIREVYGEFARLAPELEDMHAVRPRLGVFLSHQTWALKGFLPQWTAFHVAAVEHQLPKLYAYDEQLKAGAGAEFDTIVSIDNTIVDPLVAIALADFVTAGGRLLVVGDLTVARDPDGLPLPVPESVRAALGRAERLPDARPETILRALGEVASPVRFACDAMVPRSLTVEIAGQASDWPQDMTEASSLGQTLRLPHDGLQSLAIRTPTYLKTPPAGCLLEVLRDGPGGEVIAQRQVPAGIADNSWQEIAIPAAPPAGTTLYVRTVPDAALPSVNLGWWSTHQDPYADGTACVGDRPVAGDRQVKMTFRVSAPAQRLLESFILSDGLNYGVVVVNTGSEPVAAEVSLEGLLPRGLADRYEIGTPARPGAWQQDGAGGALRLPAHGATMLCARCRTSPWEAENLLAKAEAAVAVWREQDALTPYAQYAAEKARRQLAAHRPEKAAALALRILSQLGLRIEAVLADEALSLRVDSYSAEGYRMTPGAVRCDFVPTAAFSRPLTIGSLGSATLKLRRGELPGIYDYAEGCYKPYEGPLRLILSARVAGKVGRQIVDVDVR